jgi:hypothetical protein
MVVNGWPAYRAPEFIIPIDEKLIAQLTSRRKLYDSKGREKLESKADLRARGVESPDRADALIGAIVLGSESRIDWKEALALQKENQTPDATRLPAHRPWQTAHRVAMVSYVEVRTGPGLGRNNGAGITRKTEA